MSAAPDEPQVTAVVSLRPCVPKKKRSPGPDVEMALLFDAEAIRDVLARAALDQCADAIVGLGGAWSASVRLSTEVRP